MPPTSTLTWSSYNTDSASIDNGIGDVPVNGSIIVFPSETTTYTVTVAGPGGTAMDSVTVTVISLSITITSSLDGETISRPDIMVQGTIPNIEGNEMGVTVNGIGAMVEENENENGWPRLPFTFTQICALFGLVVGILFFILRFFRII